MCHKLETIYPFFLKCVIRSKYCFKYPLLHTYFNNTMLIIVPLLTVLSCSPVDDVFVVIVVEMILTQVTRFVALAKGIVGAEFALVVVIVNTKLLTADGEKVSDMM